VMGEKFLGTQQYCEACGYDEETTVIWLLKYGDLLPTNEGYTDGL